MKTQSTTARSLSVISLALLMWWGPAHAQSDGVDQPVNHKLRFEADPLPGIDMAAVRQQSEQGSGLKVWSYSIQSTRSGSKGNTYDGTIAGGDPFFSIGTTTTTVYVIPLIVQLGSTTFDPTVPDNNCLAGKVPLTVIKNSPMVKATHDFTVNGIDVGKAQYSDAFQRANFWSIVSLLGGTYHNKLRYKFLPAFTFTPDSSHYHLYSNSGGCISQYGGIEKNNFDLILRILIPAYFPFGVSPRNLPVFLLYNTTMYKTDPSDCCVGGYHSGFGDGPIQTYSTFDFDSAQFFGAESSDVAIMSHEINEWQDDPFVNNPTPSWGHVGQVSGCQGNLEVGDPLTGTDRPVVIMSGFHYHLQELAFFSWFFGPPSIGAGGEFSDNGTFTSAQGACHK